MVDKFFKSKADRDLWLKLNAENQIFWEKSLTYFDKVSNIHKPTLQALSPRSMESALTIARNQLDCDIKYNHLRMSLEDYLTKSTEQLHSDYLKHLSNLFIDKLK